MTPYKAAKVANAILKANGLKEVPPQMIYNYTTSRVNAGKTPLIPFTLEDGVTEEDITVWANKYAEKKLAKVVEEVSVEV